jgi:hypothetical protein
MVREVARHVVDDAVAAAHWPVSMDARLGSRSASRERPLEELRSRAMRSMWGAHDGCPPAPNLS